MCLWFYKILKDNLIFHYGYIVLSYFMSKFYLFMYKRYTLTKIGTQINAMTLMLQISTSWPMKVCVTNVMN